MVRKIFNVDVGLKKYNLKKGGDVLMANNKEIKPQADMFFEASWEVCNKVGGIYTVVKSKINLMQEYYKEKYFTVGPYFHDKAAGEFVEQLPPEFLQVVFGELEQEGIKCHYGRWLVKGEPNCILIDFSGYAKYDNDIKRYLWDNYGVDSLGTSYYDFDEPVVWSYTVGKLLEKVGEKKDEKIVAQFHEWMSATGLLYLEQKKANISTVFTTHATMLGRTLASSDVNLYDVLDKIDPLQEAYKYKMQAKYMVEKQAAHNADVFSTVSEITGMEAEKLLGKKPDVLLPNGLDFTNFPTLEEISIKHNMFKNKIKEFIQYYFFPYYVFDIDNTLIYFLCGRYEFHDKGIDVYIKALGKLNEKLKAENSDKTIVTFFWVPGDIRGIKPALLKNRTEYKNVRDLIDDHREEIIQRIIYAKVSGKNVNEKNLFDSDFRSEMQKDLLRFKQEGTPPLVTHDLHNEEQDEIIRAFRENNLNNAEEDRVKVIFYSIYLTGADGLLDTSYYESMIGSHLGVFPSYYEPWGYTPLEAGGLGVGSVTTDLAGFGRYLKANFKKKNPPGIMVLDRMDKSNEQISQLLFNKLYRFANFSREERIQNKIEARKLANEADWKKLGVNYLKAHNLAIKK